MPVVSLLDERPLGEAVRIGDATVLVGTCSWADATLTNLPPVLPDDSFVRTTHLKESVIPSYTTQLAFALRPHLP